MGDPRWSSLFLKDCSLFKGSTLEQGQSVRSPPPEEEGAAETTCDELTATPIPHPPAPYGRRRERNGSEVFSILYYDFFSFTGVVLSHWKAFSSKVSVVLCLNCYLHVFQVMGSLSLVTKAAFCICLITL